MKKFTGFILIAILILSSCSKDESIKSIYTEKQQKALNMFHGKFKSVSDNGHFTKHIEFYETYKTPLKMQSSIFELGVIDIDIYGKMGESSYLDTIMEERYFYISEDADYLISYTLYNNGNIGNKSSIPLIIKNQDEFILYPLLIFINDWNNII